MKKWGVIAGTAVVALVVLYVTLFRKSDEDRIREVLDRFTRAVAIKSDDNPLSRMARVKSELAETTTDDVFVVVPDLGVRVAQRAALVERATQASALYQSASCELVSMNVKLEENAATATVDATAIVTGSRGGERRVDRRPVHFLLRKDDVWRIATIDVAASRD